jgi:hypothetical protein
VAIENLENHFIFYFIFKHFAFWRNFTNEKQAAIAESSRSLSRSLSLSLKASLISRCRRSHIMSSTDTIGSLIAVHHPIPIVAHHVFNGLDRLSHRRSPPATDGRTLCFQRTRSASAAVDVDYMNRSVSIAGAHCSVFFWIGVLKTVLPLAACARPVLRMAMNLLGQQQIGSTKPRTLELPQNPPSFFFFTHQALKLIPVVAEFRTLTCSQASPEIRSQQSLCFAGVCMCFVLQ